MPKLGFVCSRPCTVRRFRVFSHEQDTAYNCTACRVGERGGERLPHLRSAQGCVNMKINEEEQVRAVG